MTDRTILSSLVVLVVACVAVATAIVVTTANEPAALGSSVSAPAAVDSGQELVTAPAMVQTAAMGAPAARMDAVR